MQVFDSFYLIIKKQVEFLKSIRNNNFNRKDSETVYTNVKYFNFRFISFLYKIINLDNVFFFLSIYLSFFCLIFYTYLRMLEKNWVNFFFDDSLYFVFKSQLNFEHFFFILPELFLGFFILVLLLFSIYLRVIKKSIYLNTLLVYKYSVLSLVLTFFIFLLTFFYWVKFNNSYSFFLFNEALILDYYSFLIRGLLLVITILLLISAWRFVTTQCIKVNIDLVEFPILIVSSILFMFIMVSSINITTSYISLEGLTLIIYMLITIPFKRENFEVVIKYFYLSAICSIIFLYGLSLLYGLTGTFSYFDINFYLSNNLLIDSLYNNSLLKFSVASVVIMFLFKIGCFPFHWWIPDVYEHSWLLITAFFMTVTKTAFFFFFIRLIVVLFFNLKILWQSWLVFSSLGSIIVGVFAGLTQTKIKRLFAYSSVAQMGFILLGLVIIDVNNILLVFFFFISYVIVILLLFIMLLNIETIFSGNNLIYLKDFKNFARNNSQWSVLKLTFLMLSLAGIPPLMGFIGKFLIFWAAISSQLYLLTLIAIIMSVINCYIYIKIIKILWFERFFFLKPSFDNSLSFGDQFIDNENLTWDNWIFLVFFPLLIFFMPWVCIFVQSLGYSLYFII